MTQPYVVGVDEAGRGCLAGPVMAGAIVVQGPLPPGLADSKKLTARQREALYEELTRGPHIWAVGVASSREVDELNVLQATFLAMHRAVAALHCWDKPLDIWVDGNQAPPFPGLALGSRVHTLVGGDALMPAISAASILAKVQRDRYMADLSLRHPGYGFEVHKGYGTAKHLATLRARGPCEEHRKTFEPVRRCLAERGSAPVQAPRVGR